MDDDILNERTSSPHAPMHPTTTSRIETDRASQSALLALTRGLTWIYAVFAMLNLARLGWSSGWPVVTANAGLAILYSTTSWLLRRQEHDAWAEPGIVVALLLAHTNTLNTIRLFDDPLHLVFVALAILGLSAFSTSARWFALGAAAMVVEWLAVRFLLGTPSEEVARQCFYLAASLILSIAVFLGRRASLGHLREALKESELARDHLAAVLDNSNDLIFEVDATGSLTYANEVWARSLETTTEAARGLEVASVVTEGSREALLRETSQPKVEVTFLSASGKEIESEGRLRYLPASPRKTSPSLIGFFRDVSRERELTRDLGRNEALLRSFAESSRQVFWIFDLPTGRFVFVNGAFEELTGWPAEELMRSPELFERLFPAEEQEWVRELIRRARGGEALTAEHRLVTRDRRSKWIRLHVDPIAGPDGSVRSIAGVSEDVTVDRELRDDLQKARSRLKAREAVLWQFVRNTPAAVAMFDREMRYLAASDRWRELYSLGDRRVIGVSHYEVFPEIGEEWRAVHRRCLDGATERSEADPFPRLDGSLQWIRWEVQPWRTESDDVGGLLIFTEDVTEERRSREALRRAARYDQLTGCLNRAAFFEDLERIWARIPKEGLGLLFLDLDGFKQINDTLGHRAGDDVLAEIGERLRMACRPGDLVARQGGDEFVVGALGIGSEGPLNDLAERVERCFAREIDTRSGSVRVHASLGRTLASAEESVKAALDRVDRQMYLSKRSKVRTDGEESGDIEHPSSHR